MPLSSFEELQKIIPHCTLCPRLVEFRETVPIKLTSKNEIPWRKPVPGFGDPNAELLILGLAPAASGGNRTGRVFTGDRSGAFMMKALYEAGFANQPTSLDKDDGLKLKNCYITAAVKCVPPKNLPLPQEFRNCSRYLVNEIFLLKKMKAVLALGQAAFNSYFLFLKERGVVITPKPKFHHGAIFQIEGWPTLYASYHPSPQNTNTGVLTEEMFFLLLETIKSHL